MKTEIHMAIRAAADSLILSGKLGKYESIDEHFCKSPGWFSQVLSAGPKSPSIIPHLKGFYHYFKSLDSKVATDMVRLIFGDSQLTNRLDTIDDMIRFIQNNREIW